ncbi:MAG TPA: hypothetical protein VMT03_22150 [Polyangia bacterium]|nr:hypothetical protein [Polyangia bacterium]
MAAALGCATAQPFSISDQRRARFEQVAQQAEVAAAAGGPAAASALVTEARSDFEYAQHLPMYPERARRLADKAEHEADTALSMTQGARTAATF